MASPIYLAIGETRRLSTPTLQTLRVEKKGLLSIKDLGDSIVFTGKKLGSTKVSLGRREYQFYVLGKRQRLTQTALTAWVKGKRGPEVTVRNREVLIQGRLLKHEDFQDLKNYCGQQAEFRLSAQPLPKAAKEIKHYVTQLLQSQNFPEGELTFSPHWTLRLNARYKKSKADLKKLLTPYGISIKFDGNDIAQVPVIKIQVYIAHVNKSFMREWGVAWPSRAATTLLDAKTLEINPIDISLKALEGTGQGQLLASPTLITESDKQAEFHSGGEFPVVTTTQFNNAVQWKRYGLFLKAKPTANAKGNLKISIDLEMSTIDQSLSQSDIPGLIRSNVNTQVNMKKPQPILLSGFLRQDRGQRRSGLPWLQQIPIFKPLFSEGAIYDNELELVFILIPSFYEH